MVKLNKIYTRTGDDGTTGLSDGSRVPKFNGRVHAYGDVDELNAHLGVIASGIECAHSLSNLISRIQNDLFDLGADLSTPLEMDAEYPALRVSQGQIDWIEQQIDHFNADLESLRSFVLPGGTRLAADLHVARCVCRRAERSVADAHYADCIDLNPLALRYLNRLSDLLFVLSRFENAASGLGDVLWVPGQNR